MMNNRNNDLLSPRQNALVQCFPGQSYIAAVCDAVDSIDANAAGDVLNVPHYSSRKLGNYLLVSVRFWNLIFSRCLVD